MQKNTSHEQPTIKYQPLIIIGAARSGTKLLRDLVAGHPDIDKVPYDVNYIWRIGNETLAHDELAPDTLKADARRRILQCLNRFHNGAPCLLEKTVGNCLRVDFVSGVFPAARYIHLIRDGQDVIESAFRQWQAPPNWRYIIKKAAAYPLSQAAGYAREYAVATFRKLLAGKHSTVVTWGPRYAGIDQDLSSHDLLTVCAIQWNCCASKALAGLASLPPGRVLTIRYEEFVQQPDLYLTKVANFAGISPRPYEALHFGAVSTANIGKGCRQLTNAQKAKIAPFIQNSQAWLGYGQQ